VHLQVILKDEPTGNLYQKTSQRIIDLLFKMNKENGTTLVMVTHDNQIANHCDRQVVISGGQLSEQEAT
jgi:putative ABC transport system ATP-binding protein